MGLSLGNQELVDGMYRDGFFCPLAKMVMGEPRKFSPNSTRSPARSRINSPYAPRPRRHALESGLFNDELAPVTLESKKEPSLQPRRAPLSRATMDKMVSLPRLSKTGTITAGNSSGITDAPPQWSCRRSLREGNNLKPLARILA